MVEPDSTFEERAPELPPGNALLPWLFAVLHCDEPELGAAGWRLDATDEVTFTRGAELDAVRGEDDGKHTLTISLPSRFASRRHARLVRARGAWVIVDEGSRNGTLLNGNPVSRSTIQNGDVLVVGHTVFMFAGAMATWPASKDMTAVTWTPTATVSPALEQQHATLARIARSDVPILLTGESGSGKEVASRAIHESSGRSGPLVPVNCASLPQGLVEAALFGHTRGAFSGAVRDEIGLVRAADNGTVFLDEIADLPLAAQSKLLRVLEDNSVMPLGTTRPVSTNVRFVSATHQPLTDLVRRGSFREDLLARLRGFEHVVPPLRDRRVDLGLILSGITRAAGAKNATFTVPAALALLAYEWPLNVRELRQCITSALALSDGAPIDVHHLATIFPKSQETNTADDLQTRLVSLLKENDGNVAAVARALGKAPIQIHRYMSKFQLDVNAFRSKKK